LWVGGGQGVCCHGKNNQRMSSRVGVWGDGVYGQVGGRGRSLCGFGESIVLGGPRSSQQCRGLKLGGSSSHCSSEGGAQEC
jgi:hypothetical protein